MHDGCSPRTFRDECSGLVAGERDVQGTYVVAIRLSIGWGYWLVNRPMPWFFGHIWRLLSFYRCVHVLAFRSPHEPGRHPGDPARRRRRRAPVAADQGTSETGGLL